MKAGTEFDTSTGELGPTLRLGGTATATIASVVILAYSGLVLAGRWQDDEYLLYSPRPLSEFLLALYGQAVLLWHKQLIGPVLALLWSGLLMSVFASARATGRRGLDGSLVAWTVTAGLACHWLTTNPVSEMFYWPMAAAAYLPIVAAATVLVLLVGRRTGGYRGPCCVALLVAGLTSEIGAALAIGFACCGLLVALAQQRGPGRRAERRWRLYWWLVPGLVALGVMVALAAYRAGVNEPIAQGGRYAGRLGASIAASVAELSREAFGHPFVLATRAGLAVGVIGLLRLVGFDAERRWSFACAAALLAACFFSLVAAYDHYGGLCCERQQALRGCLLDLAFISVAAGLIGHTAGVLTRRAALVPLAFLLMSLTSVLPRLNGLAKSYSLLHWSLDSRHRSWSSGERSGNSMVFYLPPDTPGELVRGTALPVGVYSPSSSAPALVDAVAGFFDKQQVRVCQAWQTGRSWIINGTFIPACPDP